MRAGTAASKQVKLGSPGKTAKRSYHCHVRLCSAVSRKKICKQKAAIWKNTPPVVCCACQLYL